MSPIVRLAAPAFLIALAGCAQSPIATGPLESKINQARGGDFGTCYTNVHSAAIALDEAEAGLAEIKAHQGWTSQSVYDDAVRAVDKALADRAAAEEACNARTAVLEDKIPEIEGRLDDHEARLKELERVREIVRGVTFATGSARLTAEAKTVLNVVANRLQRSPIPVEVAGHASSTGTPEMNMKLSQRRAESVRDYLISQGVDASILSARGYGVTEPIADNSTQAGRRANQRVELRFRQ